MPTPAELRERLIRNFKDAPLERFERAPLYDTRSARLAVGTAAAQLGASVDIVAPGKTSCPYHFHYEEEEMFIVLQGEGTLRVAGERLALKAGDVVFIPAGPEYPHHIINTSDAPLQYLSIGTQAKTEVCEYPDSGKVGVFAEGLRYLQKRDAGLDYWDGEP
ncbi:MAG TPA: cupin domain-containing protein [Roseateles sp.]|nr:cupin domain-containing protein [Roseateles sp.]